MCERNGPKPFVQLGVEAHGAYLQHRRDPDKSLSLTPGDEAPRKFTAHSGSSAHGRRIVRA